MFGVVACHFNPAGFQRPVKNYYRFRNQIGVPVRVVELSFNGRFIDPDAIQILGDPQKSAVWQKERLINIALDSLPDNVDRVAWLDADILFQNENWLNDTIEALDRFQVVQMFETAHDLDATGKIINSTPSVGWGFDRGVSDYLHSGFGWAARRDVVQNGLFDVDIFGNADALIADSFTGRFDSFVFTETTPPRLRLSALKWGADAFRAVLGNVGHVPGDLLHLYHGQLKNRQYIERSKIGFENDFDPETDIQINDDGVLEWTDANPALKTEFENYFARRKEDN